MSDYETTYISYSIDLVNYNTDNIISKPYISKNGAEYKLLNISSNVDTNEIALNADDKTHLYRSIVVSHPENEIVCFSPSKSECLDDFKEKNPGVIMINEIVEGTMINLFYDKRINSWEIATKGAIGGNYWFYRTQYENVTDQLQYTFREMFLDVFGGLNDAEGNKNIDKNTDINKLVFLEDFSKDYCYSFVLQHPLNHIVLTIAKPVVYLVGVYQLDGNRIITIPNSVYEDWNCFIGLNGLIKFPKCIAASIKDPNNSLYDKLQESYCSANSLYTMPGLMITNLATGDRTTMENVAYTEVRNLRGNNPNLQYQYLCLRRINKVMDFLKYFPGYKSVFYTFYKQYEVFVTNVHQSYVSYYVKKSGLAISKKYFPVIRRLHHEIYLPSLKRENEGQSNEGQINEENERQINEENERQINEEGLGKTQGRIIMRRSEISKGLAKFTPSELIYYINYKESV